MAQAEVLSLVATAVDRATPVLQQVQKSLDQIKRSAGGLEASMAQSRSAVQSYGEVFRGTAAHMSGFRTATQQTALALRNAQGQMTGFANTLGREVASSITRVQSAIVSATVSIAAFKNQLQASRELSEFAQATGFSRDMVVGLTHAAQDFGVPAEKMQQVIGQLGQKFQDLRLLGGGDFYKQLVNVPEMRRAAEEMSAVGEQIASNLITQEEGSQKQFEILQRATRDYREKYGQLETRGMLRRQGLPEEIENLTRVPWEELKRKADAYAASVRQLDPEQVKKYWEAWHKLSIELSNFTTGVLGPLLKPLSEFMNLFAAPELKKFTETQLPKVMSDLMTAYGELTKFFDGKELDWETIFNMHAVQEVDARFEYMVALNRRRWLQLKELYGGSSADVAEALKKESEALAALTKITGPPTPGIVPPVLMPGSVLGPESSIAPTPEDADRRAADLKGAAQRRAEERARRRQQQQPQRFTGGAGDGGGGGTIEGRNWTHDLLKDSPLSTNIEDRRREADATGDEKTRATTDLTDEIRKLNANFLRGVGGDFAAGTGGAVKFAPSGGDDDLRTGTGPGGGPPGGTIPGGGPPGGTHRGPSGPTIPSPNIPPQPVPVYPPGYSKAAGKRLGTAPDATMQPPGAAPAEVPVYGPGEGKAAGKRLGTAPDATMPAGGGMPSSAGKVSPGADTAIVDAAKQYNLDPNMLRSVADIESSTNPESNRNQRTQYKGLFQLNQEEFDRHGGGDIYSASHNANAAAKLFAGNRDWFTKQYNRPPTDGELYMMHLQGRGFFTKGTLTNVAGNPYPGMKGPQTPESFLAGWSQRVERGKQRFIAERGGTPPTTGATAPQAPSATTTDHDANMTLLRERGGHDKRTDPKDTGQLHPVMAERLAQAVRDYENETGQKAKIGEMYRDIATQAKYRAEYEATGQGLAARPGPNAPHQGRATDVPRGPFRDYLERNAGKYKVEFLTGDAYRRDPVHVQIPVEEWAEIKDRKAPPAKPVVEDRSAPPDPYYARRAAKAKEAASAAADEAPDAGGSKAAGKNLGPKTADADAGGPKAAGKNLGKVAAADDDDDKVDGLQAGGSANKGKPYIVGEGGPELFMPFQSGMVLPNMATKYLKGLQIGGRSLGEYFSMAQSPGRLLSSVFGGGSPLSQLLGGGGGGKGGNPLSSLMSGFGGGEGGNPLSSLMSGFGGGGGNPLQGFMGFQEGGIALSPDDPGMLDAIMGAGSLRSNYSGQPQKIAASGNIDINIGSTGTSALAKSEKSGLFENINMNRNLAEQHSSQRM